MNLSDNIENQKLQMQINVHAGRPADPCRLYLTTHRPRPTATHRPVVLAQNALDNSDFDYSKLAYTGTVGADDDYECYNFYRQRFIKAVPTLVTTAGSNTIYERVESRSSLHTPTRWTSFY
jgi:hypothetical protein